LLSEHMENCSICIAGYNQLMEFSSTIEKELGSESSEDSGAEDLSCETENQRKISDDVITLETDQWALSIERDCPIKSEQPLAQLSQEELQNCYFNFGFRSLRYFPNGQGVQSAICKLLGKTRPIPVKYVKRCRSIVLDYNNWAKNHLDSWTSDQLVNDQQNGFLLIDGKCVPISPSILGVTSSVLRYKLFTQSALIGRNVSSLKVSRDQLQMFVYLVSNPFWSAMWRLCPNTKEIGQNLMKTIFSQNDIKDLLAVLCIASEYKVDSLAQFLYNVLCDHLEFQDRFLLAVNNPLIFSYWLKSEIKSTADLSNFTEKFRSLDLLTPFVMIQILQHIVDL